MKLSFLFIALCAIITMACSDATSPEYNAERITAHTLSSKLGFEWFPEEVSSFQPDTAAVRAIKDAYSADNHKFYLYVNPSCSCKGTQKLFPHTIRILQDAGVKESDIEIYSMRSTSDKHPYMDKMPVQKLPTVFVVKNDVVVRSFSEELVGQKLESMILEGVRGQ